MLSGRSWVSRSMNASAISDHSKHERAERGHAESEAPRDECAQHAGEDFDDRVTRRDAGLARGASPAEHEPADDRDVLQRGDGVTAGGAGRARARRG